MPHPLSTLHEDHLALVIAVNEANGEDREIRRQTLSEFRRNARGALSNRGFGQMMMTADRHYLDQGIDRPMCGGEFLDVVG